MRFLPTVAAAAIAAGTWAGVWWPELRLFAALAGAALALSVWLARQHPATLVVLGCLACAALAASRGADAFHAAARPPLVVALEREGLLDDERRPRPPVQLAGRLAADAVVDGPSVLLRLHVQELGVGACACPRPAPGPVLVAVAGDAAAARAAEWRAGRLVTLPATVRRPATSRNLGAPDPAHDLVRRRLALTASVKSALQVEVQARGSWLDEWAAAVRARARRAIAAAAAPDIEAAAIGTAVLVGDRAGLDPDLTARLQRAGTFHVIAISGGNIALLSALVLVVGWRIVGGGRLAFVLTGAVLVAYAFVVGGGASVLRATGMAVVGLAARTLDQRGAAANALALTAAALLVADPLLAVDTGFWLTVLATGGLVVGLGEPEAARPPWFRLARALVLTSVWAELALLPVVAAVFQQVTVAGVVLSAAAIPGMAVAQVAAMAAVAADLVAPWALAPAGLVLRAGTWVVVESARLADLLPILSWRVPTPSMAAVALYYAALGLWLWARVPGQGPMRVRVRSAAFGVFVAALAWIAVAPASLLAWPAPATLDAVMFDVGQGDALLLRFPGGATMLVDAGGRPAGSRFDVGGRVVGPALRAHGVRRLDYLVVTHADADHIGGAATVVEEFAPREVWTGVPVADDAATAALREAAVAAGAAWRVVQRGDRVDFGAAEVAVLHPPPPDWERQRVRNDDSVVLAVTLGAVRLLLTGDIGAAVEGEVAAALARDTGGAPAGLTVLKAAHHGSGGGTSLDWLAATRPSIALVSVGRDSPFGHPAPATLARLAAARADVWRTDRDGAIHVRTDGRRLDVTAISGRTRRWPPPRP